MKGILAICVVTGFVLFGPAMPSATIIEIPDDFGTIQEGIDQALPGDTVMLMDGTYTGEGNLNVDFGGKNIVLTSLSGPEFAIIDGEFGYIDSALGLILQSGEGLACIIENIKIIRTNFGAGSTGAAVRCYGSSPTIRNCVFEDNNGAVLCHTNASPVIENCDFINNHCVNTGAALISRFNSSPTLVNCLFYNNQALFNGGAVYSENSDLEFINCVFENNVGEDGGAVFSDSGSAYFEDCEFKSNRAPLGNGGGIYAWHSSAVQFILCRFYENEAAFGAIAMLVTDNVMIYGCTAAKNNGGLMSGGTLANSIFAYNSNDHAVSGPSSIECTDIYGNEVGDWTGDVVDFLGINGNFSADPIFCDTAAGNYGLSSYSPCRPAYSDCENFIGAYGVTCPGLCGDLNADSTNNILDVMEYIRHLYIWPNPPVPPELADVNGDLTINILDITHYISWLYKNGPDLNCSSPEDWDI